MDIYKAAILRQHIVVFKWLLYKFIGTPYRNQRRFSLMLDIPCFLPKYDHRVIARKHIFISAKPLMETVIFLLQIRFAELTTDGLVLRQLCLDRSEFRYQRFDFGLQIYNGFLASFRSFSACPPASPAPQNSVPL